MPPGFPAHGSQQPSTIGPYRVLGSLGAGAAGQVLHVADSVGRGLALKLLAAGASHEHRERFEREGQLTAQLTHPGIVRVHGRGVSGDRPYLVYELIEGQDLEVCFGRLERDALLRITHEVALALGYAHEQGVVHRDVKPSNILIGHDGHARVADFGLAQAIGLERLTRSGFMLGTPRYMAPEQAAGAREQYGPATDVWALGVLLYRVLTGAEPFSGTTLPLLFSQLLSERPADPRSSDPSISPGLEEVCLRALEKSPGDRYADAGDFAADLGRALAGEPVEGLRPLRSARRGKLLGALGAGALVAACAVGWIATHPTETLPVEQDPVEEVREDSSEARLVELRADLEHVSAELTQGRDQGLRLQRLSSEATLQPTLARALWGEGLAILVDLDTEAAFLAHLPLLRALGGLPREVRGGAVEDAQRVVQRGLEVVEACFEGGAEGVVRDRDPEARMALGCEILDGLAQLGVRALETDPGIQVLDCLLACVLLQELDWGVYWNAQLNGMQLDLPSFHNYLKPQGSRSPAAKKRLWAAGSRTPWQRFHDLRVECLLNPGNPDLMRRLRTSIEDPGGFAQDAEWSLGPRQWGAAVAHLANHSPADDANHALLKRAIAGDPENPVVYRSLATWLRRRERLEESRQAIVLAVACHDRNYAANIYRHWLLPKLLQDEVGIRAALGDREGARESWRRLQAEGPDSARQVEKQFPWLRSD